MALNKESVHLLTVQYGTGIMQVITEIGDNQTTKDGSYFSRNEMIRLIRPLQIFANQEQDGKVKVGLVPVDPFMDEKADIWVRSDCVTTISVPSAQLYKAYSEARTGLMLPESQTPAGLHLVH